MRSIRLIGSLAVLVAACVLTTGCSVFFDTGDYRAGTRSGGDGGTGTDASGPDGGLPIKTCTPPPNASSCGEGTTCPAGQRCATGRCVPCDCDEDGYPAADPACPGSTPNNVDCDDSTSIVGAPSPTVCGDGRMNGCPPAGVTPNQYSDLLKQHLDLEEFGISQVNAIPLSTNADFSTAFEQVRLVATPAYDNNPFLGAAVLTTFYGGSEALMIHFELKEGLPVRGQNDLRSLLNMTEITSADIRPSANDLIALVASGRDASGTGLSVAEIAPQGGLLKSAWTPLEETLPDIALTGGLDPSSGRASSLSILARTGSNLLARTEGDMEARFAFPGFFPDGPAGLDGSAGSLAIGEIPPSAAEGGAFLWSGIYDVWRPTAFSPPTWAPSIGRIDGPRYLIAYPDVGLTKLMVVNCNDPCDRSAQITPAGTFPVSITLSEVVAIRGIPIVAGVVPSFGIGAPATMPQDEIRLWIRAGDGSALGGGQLPSLPVPLAGSTDFFIRDMQATVADSGDEVVLVVGALVDTFGETYTSELRVTTYRGCKGR